jgi:DNA (cytosine-5)-methyltransferase 1
MRWAEVCSGISAASVAFAELPGWECAVHAEIAPFPRAVLEHRYPGVPLHGDFTSIAGQEYGPIQLLIGGTPCQSFSTSGLRGGLADDRGNLALEFLRLADRSRARWVAWENVTGVLSQDEGRAFGSILGGLAELGYGFAYRVLDAQFFGVAQRRRRVFVVGYLGDWRAAAAVLSERGSVWGNPRPLRDPGQDVARSIGASSHDWSRSNPSDYMNLIAFDTTQLSHPENRSNPRPGDPCHSIAAGAHVPAIAYEGGEGVKVRRMTVREVERCFGFPDDYTLVPYNGRPADRCPEGLRFESLGNSIAVPVLGWLGGRIDSVDRLMRQAVAA